MRTTFGWKQDADLRRRRREGASLTLEELGAAIGLSASQLHRYERGKAAARADIIERWEAGLAAHEALLDEETV